MARRDLDRSILRLAVPALGTVAIEPLYVLVDTAIVGHLGAEPLAGLALAGSILWIAFWALNLPFALTPRVAFFAGRADQRRAAGVAAQGLAIGLCAGAVFGVVVLIGGGAFARGLGGAGGTLIAATTYLRISALGLPAVFLAYAGHGYLRGVQNTRTPLAIVAVANAVNVVLEIMFVYVLHWGVAGSAWGTVIAQWGAAVWFVLVLRRSIASAGAPWRLDWREIGGLLSSLRRLIVRAVALLAALTLATRSATRIGTAALAAHQIVLQIYTFLGLAVDALAIAAQSLVGTAAGAGTSTADLDRRLLRLSVRVGIGLALLVALTTPFLPGVFTSDPAVEREARVAMLWSALNQIPAAIAFTYDGILIGRSRYGVLQWLMCGALLAMAPVVLGAGSLTQVWVGLLVWMVARAAGCALAVLRLDRPAAALDQA